MVTLTCKQLEVDWMQRCLHCTTVVQFLFETWAGRLTMRVTVQRQCRIMI